MQQQLRQIIVGELSSSCPEFLLVGPFSGVHFFFTGCSMTDGEWQKQSEAAWVFVPDWVTRHAVQLPRSPFSSLDAIQHALSWYKRGSNGMLDLILDNNGRDRKYVELLMDDTAFEACWKAYTTTVPLAVHMTREEFEREFRPCPPALALLVVSRDNELLVLQRPTSDASSELLDVCRAEVEIDGGTMTNTVLRCVEEARLRPSDIDLDSIIWLGLSNDAPLRRPVILAIAQSTCTVIQIIGIRNRARATGPLPCDGAFYPLSEATLTQLLSEEAAKTTLSLGACALFTLLRAGISQGIITL